MFIEMVTTWPMPGQVWQTSGQTSMELAQNLGEPGPNSATSARNRRNRPQTARVWAKVGRRRLQSGRPRANLTLNSDQSPRKGQRTIAHDPSLSAHRSRACAATQNVIERGAEQARPLVQPELTPQQTPLRTPHPQIEAPELIPRAPPPLHRDEHLRGHSSQTPRPRQQPTNGSQMAKDHRR